MPRGKAAAISRRVRIRRLDNERGTARLRDIMKRRTECADYHGNARKTVASRRRSDEGGSHCFIRIMSSGYSSRSSAPSYSVMTPEPERFTPGIRRCNFAGTTRRNSRGRSFVVGDITMTDSRLRARAASLCSDKSLDIASLLRDRSYARLQLTCKYRYARNGGNKMRQFLDISRTIAIFLVRQLSSVINDPQCQR